MGVKRFKYPVRTYAPKMTFYEARSALEAYYDISTEADKKFIALTSGMRLKTLESLVYEIPEGMIPLTRLQRVIALIEKFENLLNRNN